MNVRCLNDIFISIQTLTFKLQGLLLQMPNLSLQLKSHLVWLTNIQTAIFNQRNLDIFMYHISNDRGVIMRVRKKGILRLKKVIFYESDIEKVTEMYGKYPNEPFHEIFHRFMLDLERLENLTIINDLNHLSTL